MAPERTASLKPEDTDSAASRPSKNQFARSTVELPTPNSFATTFAVLVSFGKTPFWCFTTFSY